MEITQAHKEDLTPMIALLKQSLGESLVPKSEEYFLWKHEKNPFGRSKILLAKQEGKIVGLRAFMHWSWVSQMQKISAVRAVDTATDPAFQGKGIFKKLTLQAVEECTKEGVDMVFNSPNPVSMQGYLKMGWSAVGRMPIYIGPGSIIPRPYSEKGIDDCYNKYPAHVAINKIDIDWALPVSASALHTPVHYDYLKWRYQDCPVVKYGAIIETGKFGLVFRLKKISRFIELRICETWTEPGASTDQLVRAAFRELVRKIRPALVSCAFSPLLNEGKKQLPGLFGPFKKGPVITIRPLKKNNLNNFEQFKHWQPSLGTMELF